MWICTFSEWILCMAMKSMCNKYLFVVCYTRMHTWICNVCCAIFLRCENRNWIYLYMHSHAPLLYNVLTLVHRSVAPYCQIGKIEIEVIQDKFLSASLTLIPQHLSINRWAFFFSHCIFICQYPVLGYFESFSCIVSMHKGFQMLFSAKYMFFFRMNKPMCICLYMRSGYIILSTFHILICIYTYRPRI